MNRKFFAIVSSLLIASTVGCTRKTPSIEGKWAIDLTPMVQQAKSLNASNRHIESMKETFRDGQLKIDSHRITIVIEGMGDGEVYEYVVSSMEGACTLLSIQSSAKPHKYCVSGSRLEVHDPSTPLIAVYQRM